MVMISPNREIQQPESRCSVAALVGDYSKPRCGSENSFSMGAVAVAANNATVD